MLEHVDLTKKIAKPAYSEVFPELEMKLGEIQRKAREAISRARLWSL